MRPPPMSAQGFWGSRQISNKPLGRRTMVAPGRSRRYSLANFSERVSALTLMPRSSTRARSYSRSASFRSRLYPLCISLAMWSCNTQMRPGLAAIASWACGVA